MSAPLRVLIADDERAARWRLRQLLSARADLCIVAEACHGAEALAQIEALRPDLVLLDIEMPELDGFEMLARLPPTLRPGLVFATAHERFALPAFAADAIDYLLKPFDEARLTRALDKARRWLHAPDRGAGPAPSRPQRLLLKTADSALFVPLQDVRYITAARNYIHVHAADGLHTVRESLQAFEQRLDPGRFRRIHRSHIVNLDHVRKILPWYGGDSLVLMSDGNRLNLSRNYRAVLAEFA